MKVKISAKAVNIVDDLEEAIIENMTAKEMHLNDEDFGDLVKERAANVSKTVKKFFAEEGYIYLQLDTENEDIKVIEVRERNDK